MTTEHRVGSVRAEVAGKGAPLVLIAGLGGAIAFWRPLIGQLADHYTTIALEYLPEASATESIEGKVSDIRGVLDQLELDSAAIVGHSSGGATAQRFALAYPSLVNALVLSGTWAGTTPYVDTLFALRGRLLERLGRQDYLLDGLARATPPEWFSQRLEEVGVEGILDFRGAVNNDVEQARIRQIREFDNRPHAAEISARTLVVTASDDAVFPPSHARELASLVPHGELQLLDYGAHLAPITNPSEYARTLVTFFRSLGIG